ncbi:hypothetical protein [Streptomyces umbrinus]|uniref:hypothetical protein n=1 Tax=Streptomyces umbrinus TaxID=67370 RepID=UPI003424422C
MLTGFLDTRGVVLEPVSAALLLALATGGAGAAGGQAWQGLVALVRRWQGQQDPTAEPRAGEIDHPEWVEAIW